LNLAIDENVIAVANDIGRSLQGLALLCPEADDDCRLACIEALQRAIRSEIVLLDDQDLVLSYYRRKASMSGQPGSGDAFLMAVYQNSYNPERVLRIGLPEEHGRGLPESFVQCGFDADDMIYLALARNAPPAQVLNAVDSDYTEFAVQIEELGVSVVQLCGR
jgi:hypothetical protein